MGRKGRFEPSSKHQGESFADETFDEESIVDVDFTGAVLRGSTWTRCTFGDDGEGVLLREADLTEATFEDCHFGILHAEGVRAKGVKFVRCTFGYASFSDGDLEGATFEDIHVDNGLYFTKSKCARMSLSLVAEATYEPGTVDLVGADLRGAVLSARLSKKEAARIRKNDFREMTWDEFTMQKAETDGETRFEYGKLPFDDEPKKPKAKRKLGKRSGVLDHAEWGTIASIACVGDRVYTGEGGWSGDAKRYGAKGQYRVAAWVLGSDEPVWETKLLAGSNTDEVTLVADATKVYAHAADMALVLDARSGEIVSREEVGQARWVEPGVVAIIGDGVLVRELGSGKGTKLGVDWVDRASPDATVLWTQLGYDAEVGDYVWGLRSRTDESIATRAGTPGGACFSGDSTKHASGWDDGLIEIREARTGELLRDFPPAPTKKRQPKVGALALDRDGSLLAGASGPTQVTIWDVRTGDARATYGKLEPPIRAIAFSADGKSLYVGTGLAKEDRCLSVFPV